MNLLLKLIACYRYERLEDQSYMAFAARKKYQQDTLPMLEKAFPDPEEFDRLHSGISGYVAATELSAYLDGIRDGIGIFTFQGAYENASGESESIA